MVKYSVVGNRARNMTTNNAATADNEINTHKDGRFSKSILRLCFLASRLSST
jgi:hypothetical protein